MHKLSGVWQMYVFQLSMLKPFHTATVCVFLNKFFNLLNTAMRLDLINDLVQHRHEGDFGSTGSCRQLGCKVRLRGTVHHNIFVISTNFPKGKTLTKKIIKK